MRKNVRVWTGPECRQVLVVGPFAPECQADVRVLGQELGSMGAIVKGTLPDARSCSAPFLCSIASSSPNREVVPCSLDLFCTGV
jgi:hypothetical protein